MNCSNEYVEYKYRRDEKDDLFVDNKCLVK